jgi:uncharacterized protein
MENATESPFMAQGITTVTAPRQEIKPIALGERIQSIDVVRGFALIGIFFMNIEWFNRSFIDFSLGIPADAQGLDWWANYFVNFFVAGKFWTIFSLLFGMGFAIMLTRSEETGRAFLLPYIRRIIALGIFGFLHTVLVWPGDILLGYAFTAAGLLIVLFGTWKWIVLSILGLGGIVFIPGLNSFGAVISGIILMGIIALFLRNEKLVSLLGKKLPLFSFIFLILGTLVSMAAVASFFVAPMKAAREVLLVISFVTLSFGFLSAIFHQPASARTWRAGVWLALLPFVIGTVFGIVDLQKPHRNVFDSPAAVKLADEKEAKKLAEENAKKAAAANPMKASASASASASAAVSAQKSDKKEVKAEKTEAEKQLEDDSDRIVRIRKGLKDRDEDLRILTKGSYVDVVKHRAKEFFDAPFNPAGQAFGSIALFLIGVWFVRSGVMRKDRENLPLFRRLAVFGLPIGLGLSVFASTIAVSSVRGEVGGGFDLVRTLVHIAALPTCLAYMSILILMLHSNSIFSNVKILAPFGRMALTNYLSQSVIQAVFFYGYGFGHFGMGRASQLAFAVGVIILQILFSHVWLSMFRYGPMEWLWRAITYWEIPAMRVEKSGYRQQAA